MTKAVKPIIFIPGIEATALANSNSMDFDIVWNAYDTYSSSIITQIKGPYIEDKLQLNPLYDVADDSIIERNHIANLPYRSLINDLKNKLPDTPIFLFGYDWRMSCIENARRLGVFVCYLKEKLKSKNVQSFRFLTHSMGGLIFSCYLNQLNGNYNEIDKVILTAPPFKGSPYSLIHLIKGVGGLKSFFNRIFGYNYDIRKVLRTYPSVFELLPWYENALTLEDGSEVNLLEMNNWQSNIYAGDNDLFQARLDLLAKFRSNGITDLSNLPQEIRNKMIIIIGTGDDTLTYLNVKHQAYQVDKFVCIDECEDEKKDGDGTVPFISSSIYKENILTFSVEKEGIFKEPGNVLSFHGLFLKDSRVKNIVNRFFADDNITANINDLSGWWKSIGKSVNKL